MKPFKEHKDLHHVVLVGRGLGRQLVGLSDDVTWDRITRAIRVLGLDDYYDASDIFIDNVMSAKIEAERGPVEKQD